MGMQYDLERGRESLKQNEGRSCWSRQVRREQGPEPERKQQGLDQ